MTSENAYGETAEQGWRWVLDQVQWDDEGPWIPESVGPEAVTEPPTLRYGMHSGVGGLAHVLAEIRLARPWTLEEQRLADGIVAGVRGRLRDQDDVSYFDGVASDIGVLVALDAEGSDLALERVRDLALPDGWRQGFLGPPSYGPDARALDATLGAAGVLLAALWVRQRAIDSPDTVGRRVPELSEEVARGAVRLLLAEAEETDAGVNWPFVPVRQRLTPRRDMPNWSHGLAGIATAMTLAGHELGDLELVDLGRRGAEHLVGLRVPDQAGLVIPHLVPPAPELGLEPWAYGWCHGPTGTSLLFVALDGAGVENVSGDEPLAWQRRCFEAIVTSGLPERVRPGFWDNDGRCCGTAGVADTMLDSWQRGGDERDLAFARTLGDALLERAIVEGDRANWRFLEHRSDDPALPPGVGWMQGAAGIAGLLFRLQRVVTEGRHAAAVSRMDNWWALPRDGR